MESDLSLVMSVKNRYILRSRVSEARFRAFLRLFCLDLTATQIAKISGLNRNTVNRWVQLIRRRMADICERQARMEGIIEADESYFGPKRIRGKRGRGAGGKTIVFGLHKRGEHVFTQIVPDCGKAALQRVIRGHVGIESVIHTDGWRGYNGLVDLGYAKHLRVHHNANEFANETSHINGIESFWGFAKNRLIPFKGVRRNKFYLHLKESEFRFNHRRKDMYQILLRELRKSPLS